MNWCCSCFFFGSSASLIYCIVKVRRGGNPLELIFLSPPVVVYIIFKFYCSFMASSMKPTFCVLLLKVWFQLVAVGTSGIALGAGISASTGITVAVEVRNRFYPLLLLFKFSFKVYEEGFTGITPPTTALFPPISPSRAFDRVF